MAKKSKKHSPKTMTPEEVQAMMIQAEKEAILPSLLYVTRKLGEVEAWISMQQDPGKTLVDVQGDLRQLYNKLVEEAGIEQVPESTGEEIGGDSYY
jgi:hypothetical protein